MHGVVGQGFLCFHWPGEGAEFSVHAPQLLRRHSRPSLLLGCPATSCSCPGRCPALPPALVPVASLPFSRAPGFSALVTTPAWFPPPSTGQSFWPCANPHRLSPKTFHSGRTTSQRLSLHRRFLPELVLSSNHRNQNRAPRPGGFPGGASGKEPAYQRRSQRRWGFDPGVVPWRRAWQPRYS